MINIVTVSGGIQSAIVADIVIKEIPEVRLIFTDTKWEDPDLYRFLSDLEKYWGKEIIRLSDGRNPEELMYDQGILANDRVPICSRILKGEVLQKYIKEQREDDEENEITIYFGIDWSESHRCNKINRIYDKLKIKTRYPLIERKSFFDKPAQIEIIKSWGIEIPRLYREGFQHNNCNGGCVRQGAKSWRRLLQVRPDVFGERERVEREFKDGKYTFLKNISLSELHDIDESQCRLFDDDEPCMCFEV